MRAGILSCFYRPTAVAGHDQALPSRCQAWPATETGLATEDRQTENVRPIKHLALPSGFGNGYTKSLICQRFSLPVTIERVKTDLEVRLSQSLHAYVGNGQQCES
jgi:hypothetical protein